jgi:hypothetical protein
MWTVGDVNVARCTHLMMIGKNFCWWIVIFAGSSRKAEDGGFISFGNQELRENILHCARYWENFLMSSESTTEWTYRLRFEISVVIIFVSLVPKRQHISHKFYQISFFQGTANRVLTAAGVWPDSLELRGETRQPDRVQWAAAISHAVGHFYSEFVGR